MRICFVGDSFVNGTGDPEGLGWVGRICAAACGKGYDLTYYNLGIRRETSTDISDRWFAEVARRLPKEFDGRIVFSFGVNDTTDENAKTRVAPKDSLANLYSILNRAKQQFPVLMVGPPPVADQAQTARIVHLSEQFAMICNQLKVPYLEVVTPLQASNLWMSEIANNDGAHPRSAGYAELAQLVQNWTAWMAWFPPI
jgi:lysophospholipase L1-like esterase